MQLQRTLIGNILSKKNQRVCIKGWIRSIRKHAHTIFLEVYDQSGLIQCVYNDINHKFIRGSCVEMIGNVVSREMDQINEKQHNGGIEIHVTSYTIYSEPKYFIEDNVGEETMLLHRPLYLHQEELRHRINVRSNFFHSVRNWAVSLGFQEIQTPILTSATMEGARDFLIPSRLHPGKFYALPQAPQIPKQLLMVGGVEKYYQIAPCFRDEDARQDRCYGEFYQLDMEMAFIEINDILQVLQSFIEMVKNFSHKECTFTRMDYKDAINIYGSDKPDLRYNFQLEDFTEEFMRSGMDMFIKQINNGAKVKGVRAQCKNPNKVLEETKKLGFNTAFIKKQGQEITGPIAKFLNNIKINDGDTIFFVCAKDAEKKAGQVIDILKEPMNHDILHFIFIENFPMFENKNGKWEFAHNPFSKPQNPTDNPEHMHALQYDLVCNGYEIASGGLRNADYQCLLDMFKIIGYSEEMALDQFSIIKSLRDYAPPPHGGFAIGLERMVMILTNAKTTRDVCAFPLNTKGVCSLMNAPNIPTAEQLAELHIKVVA